MARSSGHRNGAVLADLRHDRILFVLLSAALTVFGLLMIYSASSIMALTSSTSNHDPAYYLIRQLIFAMIGLVIAIVISLGDYHLWSRRLLWFIGVANIILLGLVLTPAAGADAYGATRWIAIGHIHLQPSEFAKAALILAGASIIEDYVMFQGEDMKMTVKKTVLLVALPLLLIIREPDKGTTLIIGMTIGIMLFVAGLPTRAVLLILGAVFLGIVFLAVKDEYSRRRILIMLDPWLDQYGDGYQLIQGLYAFGSGGLFGVGIGNSRQKYSYLPMAHNDFIFAVIGEELGLVGTLMVLAAFFALVYLGYKVASRATDLSGRLIAAGSVSSLALQLLLNVSGVLGLFPLSGKPIPFLSYGGSSIMSTLILVGLVVSVSRTTEREIMASESPLTVYEGSSGGLRLLQGGAGNQMRAERIGASRGFTRERPAAGISWNTTGPGRIDLGYGATERLRGR